MELLKVQEVAVLVNVSVETINYWYAFKRKYPSSEYAKMLPRYISDGKRQTRFWKKEDVWQIIAFKQAIPLGRKGVLGAVTQRYVKKKRRRKKNDKNRKKGIS